MILGGLVARGRTMKSQYWCGYMAKQTLYDKLWEQHVVLREEDAEVAFGNKSIK